MKSFSFSVKSVEWVKKKKKKPEKKKNYISSPRRALGVRRKKNQTQGFDICVSLETQKYDRLYGAPTILCLIYQVFVKFEKNVPLRVIYFISTVTGSSPQAISKAPSTVSVFILKIKMFIECIGQLRLFWHLWRHWKGFIAWTSRANAIPSNTLPFMW